MPKEKKLMLLRELLPSKCSRLTKRIKEPRPRLKQLKRKSRKLKLYLRRRTNKLKKLGKTLLLILRNLKLRLEREKLRPKHSEKRTKKPQQKPRPKERQPLPPPELQLRRLINFNLPLERRETNKWLLSTRRSLRLRKLPLRSYSRMFGRQALLELQESKCQLLHSRRPTK